MITYWTYNNGFTALQSFSKNTWINVTDPGPEEIEFLTGKLKVSSEELTDILDVSMDQVLAKLPAVLERIVPRDKVIARVEIELQVFRIKVVEQPLHELAVVSVWTMRFHGNHHSVVLRPRKALPIIVTRDPKDLFARQSLDLKSPVGRVNAGALQFGSKPN